MFISQLVSYNHFIKLFAANNQLTNDRYGVS